jgi:hypothetical protein
MTEEPERFKLPRSLLFGAAVGGVSCLLVAATVANSFGRLFVLLMSALFWILLIDALKCGVWLRRDGIDLRIPLAAHQIRIGWRDMEEVERKPRGRSGYRLVLHLEDGILVHLPVLRDQDRLAEALERQVDR